MSIRTFDSALDFMPETSAKIAATDQAAGAIGTLKAIASAISEGIGAAHDYERLTALGVKADVAARKVFESRYPKG